MVVVDDFKGCGSLKRVVGCYCGAIWWGVGCGLCCKQRFGNNGNDKMMGGVGGHEELIFKLFLPSMLQKARKSSRLISRSSSSSSR